MDELREGVLCCLLCWLKWKRSDFNTLSLCDHYLNINSCICDIISDYERVVLVLHSKWFYSNIWIMHTLFSVILLLTSLSAVSALKEEHWFAVVQFAESTRGFAVYISSCRKDVPLGFQLFKSQWLTPHVCPGQNIIVSTAIFRFFSFSLFFFLHKHNKTL